MCGSQSSGVFQDYNCIIEKKKAKLLKLHGEIASILHILIWSILSLMLLAFMIYHCHVHRVAFQNRRSASVTETKRLGICFVLLSC